MIVRRGIHILAALSLLLSGPVGAQSAASVAAPDVADTPASALYTPQDKDERGLWQAVDEQERQLKTSNFVIRDAALNAYVHGVFCRTIGPDCEGLRLYILRTPYVNATTSPNGMIQLWSGTFLRTHDEAQLAAVLAHEYVHYRERHFIQLWRNLKQQAGAATFMAMFGIVGGLMAIAQLSNTFAFSREQESKADADSIALLARAGYDPFAATRLWAQIRAEADATALARNVKSRKDKTGGIFATHPPTAERMTALKALAEKTIVAGTPRLNRAEYRAALAPLWASFIDDQVKMNDFGGSELLIANLATEGWTPALNYARGELYRARGRPDDLIAAARFYTEATTVEDCPAEAWRGLGLSLLRSGAADDGKAALRKYLTRRPDASDKAILSMMAGV